ncbi:MAG: toll/interleukin-1 receptor domain-containing protein [Methylococcaceae bacterium]|nr:toll/interleukin-1 receptor domain-containing protein [Methylococcaceae bacterium]
MTEPLTHLDDRFWNRLLKAVEEGQVVPVVGSQLLGWPDQGRIQTLQQRVALRVLAFYRIDTASLQLTPQRELHEVVTLLKNTANLQDLYADIAEALDAELREPAFKLPTAIEKLAAIASFRLLVTLTPDTLLAQALRKRCAVNEIIHSPNLPTSEAGDLAADWLKKPGEVNLLYLFGKAQSTPVFAIHDEDTLEYAHNLLSRGSNVPLRFLGELQQRGLLFIGTNFPDWLSRFLLRLTNQTRLSDKKTRAWLVNDGQTQPELCQFLQGFSRETEIISDLSPQAFVDELYSRWLARNTPSSDQTGSENRNPLPDPASVAFFISYSRASDLPAAEKLYQTLRETGLAENEIWFDRTSIEPGGDFQQLIYAGIRGCRYFLPLISTAADRFDEKFFYREWNAAIDRSKGISGREFVVPIILDEEYNPQAYTRVPKQWADNIDFGYAPGGSADARTRQHLTKLIRELRRGEQP